MWRFGWIFALGIAFCGVSLAGDEPLLRATPHDAALEMDGRFDEPVWATAPRLEVFARSHIHPNYRAAWTDAADLSAAVRAVITTDDLYLALEVRDDRLIHTSGRAWWAGDSVEVFFDTDSRDGDAGDRYTNDDYQLFLLPFHESLRWGVVGRGPDAPYPSGGLRGIEVAHTRTGTGYAIEVRIPLRNFDQLHPDANGRIGFDLAINDVDDPAAVMTETYMTLSGRFDLFSTPKNFGKLEIGPRPAAVDASPPPAEPASEWPALVGGLAAVALLAFLAHRFTRGLGPASPLRTAVICGLLAVGALAFAVLPTLALWLDEASARNRWADAVEAAEAAALGGLTIDSGTADARAARVHALLRDGQVRIRPRYAYTMAPLGPTRGPASARAPGPYRYGIELASGEERTFPLARTGEPRRLRLDLGLPRVDALRRPASPVATVRVEFREGPPHEVFPRADETQVLIDLEQRRPERLIVRNATPSRTLTIEGLYGETATDSWRALPLAAWAPAGVPFDIWHDRPSQHLRPVPAGGATVVPVAALSGDRMWLAIAAEGAYPRSAHGIPVARVRVTYEGGVAGPALDIVNGRDLEDRHLAYTRRAGAPLSIALTWEDSGRLPRLYTLHSLALDRARPIESVEVADLGVLASLRVAALTLGRRTVAAPPSRAGLRLESDGLSVRPDVHRQWQPFGLVVRAPSGATTSSGPLRGVRVASPLPFGPSERGELVLFLPRGDTALAVLERQALTFGLAALCLALGVLVAGAAALRRARHLRTKMLVALGAATVVPLLFLVVSLTRILNTSAEADLEKATLDELRHVAERIEVTKVRARELASSTRDTLELVPEDDAEALRLYVRRSREEIRAQGAFLRLPELDGAGPSPLGNVSFFDGLRRSGLYYSPWDGLVALGLAQTARRQRCLVGLPADTLLAGPPQDDRAALLFSPDGDPLAANGTLVDGLHAPAHVAAARTRLADALRAGQPLFEPHASLRGESVAAAFAPVRDDGRVVGLLGVYHPRAGTERRKAAIYRTVLLSALAALLLVVIAGGTLVDRVTARLRRVTSAARSIAQGDLKSRVPIEASDEVGRLAASFNTMADALDGRVRQLTDLHRGLHELTAALDRTEVARVAAALLARATGAKHILVAAREPVSDRLEPLHRVGDGASLGARLAQSGPERDAVELKRVIVREGCAFVPLVAAGRCVGLALCSPIDAGEQDRAFLDASARQIGIALENARLYHDAVTDELTGLYTHTFFVRRLKEEVDRAAATARPLSLLRVVIDDYRAIGRRQGAAVAARLVAETAATIETVLPRRNMIARRDAGELLALLVESDRDGARRHTSRIGAALQRHEFACLRDQPRPTFTYRTVTFPHDGAAADILMDSLLEVTEAWDESETDAGPALRLPEDGTGTVVLSRSPTMRAALEVVARVAPTNATVLLSGETGSGKEVVADLIQVNSNRRDKPWVKVNCAAIPDTLVETELFGHEKGAFTGAERRHQGRFERAHTGTLFLDEVGELPAPTQVKLLRVLQEQRITRVGGSAAVPVDVRIVAASNKDLGELVRRGEFREDLFHRLHVVELRVPPLRERREDIPRFADQFRQELNRRHGLKVAAFTPDAIDALYRHDWPGNVRELRNCVERAMLMAGGEKVDVHHLQLPESDDAPAAAPSIEGLTPRQERILAGARVQGGITNGDVVKQEEVSSRTALRELQRLVDRGLLIRVGRRRGAVYRPAE